MTRGTHSAVEQAPVVGDAVGRYRIIGVLGDGRLGRLYVAEQNEIRGVSKIVALRYIRPELTRSPQFRAHFLDAARIAARCEHPSVVNVFELGDADGRHFISMEYLPGENVASILRRCNTRDAMPADTAAYVVKQAAAALQYLHDLREASPQRVSARLDTVDPSNVFVSYHGTVKWLGFGLRTFGAETASGEAIAGAGAASPASSSSLASAGGLANAASPASAARPAAASDAEQRAYVFQLGALLRTCLGAGAPPPSLAAADGAPAESGPGSSRRAGSSSLRPALPDALDAILKRALSSDPLQRFESPRAMAEALDRYLFQRESRPTPKHLRRWMEQLFDSERASLQMQIARARDVEAALSHLLPAALGPGHPAGSSARPLRPFTSPRPRELWSTGHAVFSPLSRASIAPPRSFERVIGVPDESRVTAIPMRHMPSAYETGSTTLASAELPPLAAPALPPLAGQLPSAPASAARTGWIAAAAALCAVGAIGVLVLVSASRAPSSFEARAGAAAPADRTGRAEIRSKPEGAAVFVDGEPTGLRTPVVLKGLAPGRTIRVRVDKAGFASQEQPIEIASGSVAQQTFELSASAGRVLFEGAPPAARVYVDDVPVDVRDGAPVNLSVGPHDVRVETPSALLFSDTVEVVAGEQTIQLGGEQNP